MLELEPQISIEITIDAKPIDLIAHVDQPGDHHRAVDDRTPDKLAAVIERSEGDVESSTSSHGE